MHGPNWDLGQIAALEPDDVRQVTMNAAGPAALTIAKVHKLTPAAIDLLRELATG